MACAQGSRHEINYIAEAEFGVTPAIPVFKNLRNTGTNLELSKNAIVSEELRSDRQISDARHGNKQVGGDINFELSADTFDDMLEAVLGGTWTTDVLKAGTMSRTFTIERNFTDIGQYMRYTGMMANTLSLSVQPDAIVTGTVGFVGKGQTVDTSIITGATYDDPTTTLPFDSFSGTVKEGGTEIAVVTGIDLTLENGAEANFVIGSDETPCITTGNSNLTGTLTAQFKDEVLLQKFIDETESQLEFTLDDGTKSQTWLMPRIKYTGGSVPVSGGGLITISLPFQAIMDAATETQIQITRA
jgi:hypothetical protein